MGLDMYLEKEIYVGAEYAHNKVEGTIYITRNGKKLPINFNKVSSITERVAYWRKANMIHNWFVQNVQNGVDDCGRYFVSVEKLEELVNICKEVLADHSKAEELLPTAEGFFFGNTNYDEDYFYDLEITVEQLSNLDENDDYYYSSSW